MRQAIALLAAIPLAFVGYMATHLTREPEGVPMMVVAAMLVVIAMGSPFSKFFSAALDYSVYAIVFIAFGTVIYANLT